MQTPQGFDGTTAASCFLLTINRSRREFHELGAPSTLVLNQYCDDNVEREFAGALPAEAAPRCTSFLA
jgi:hypothetical protein